MRLRYGESPNAVTYRIGDNNAYTLHNYSIDHPEMTYMGTSSLPYLNVQLPLLHRFPVTLSVHAGNQRPRQASSIGTTCNVLLNGSALRSIKAFISVFRISLQNGVRWFGQRKRW